MLSLVPLPGCASPPPEFPPSLAFPARVDRLVLKLPDCQPTGIGEPGRLDAEIAALDALGGKTFDPAAVPPERRRALDRFLAEAFGTPAAPTLMGGEAAAERLGLTPERLAEGGRLYRRHCLQCHGLAGDGRGPTGAWIHPHPRDFRRGAFKFVSTGDGGKPSRSDLLRTLAAGLKGTAMPAFALLPDEQRGLMAGFVVYLAVRGEVEYRTLAAEAGDDADDDAAAFARGRLKAALAEWERADRTPATVTVPADFERREGIAYAEAVRRGYELFAGQSGAGCAGCHEDFGRKAAHRYDAWGTAVRPADLTAAAYKGGNRSEVLFARVRGGIAPAGMPSHPSLTDAQVWDLVRFVRAVPFPRDLPPGVREKVHPKAE